MELTELGLKNLLESLDTDKVSIEDCGYNWCTNMISSAHIYITHKDEYFYIRNKEVYYSINLAYDYCYRVTVQSDKADYAEHISLIDLLKELRPYMKKAE